MPHAALMRFFTRALAVVLVVVAHGFLLNLGDPRTTALGFAYGASIVCLGVAAALLWRKSMQSD